MALKERQRKQHGRMGRGTREVEPPTLRAVDQDFYAPSSQQERTRAMSPAQVRYIASINSKIITFGVGPAGSGKSYVASALAAEALLDGTVRKIIVTRPTIEVGHTLGFLPGELADKFAPYIAPVRDVLQGILGMGHYNYALKAGRIVPVPLELMRGLTFDNCWIVFDEAQNSTPAQMKMFLTRIGTDTKVVINGDLSQSDLPPDYRSGLEDALERFSDYPEVGVVTFTHHDCVRSGIARRILEGYL